MMDDLLSTLRQGADKTSQGSLTFAFISSTDKKSEVLDL